MTDGSDLLVLELEALAARLRPPDPAVDVAGAAVASIRRDAARRRRRHRLVLLAAAAAVIVALVVSVPTTRRAVADLLGLGGARISQTTTLPENIGDRLDLGRPVSLLDAEARAPGPVAFPSTLGRPDAAFAGRPRTGVSFVWAPTDGLPRVGGHDDVGLLLTVFRGDLDEQLIEKLVPPGTVIERPVVGNEAYWLGGDAHAFMYLDEHGDAQPETARLAANTLLWERDGVTYRLESGLDRDDAVDLATSISRAAPG